MGSSWVEGGCIRMMEGKLGLFFLHYTSILYDLLKTWTLARVIAIQIKMNWLPPLAFVLCCRGYALCSLLSGWHLKTYLRLKQVLIISASCNFVGKNIKQVFKKLLDKKKKKRFMILWQSKDWAGRTCSWLCEVAPLQKPPFSLHHGPHFRLSSCCHIPNPFLFLFLPVFCLGTAFLRGTLKLPKMCYYWKLADNSVDIYFSQLYLLIRWLSKIYFSHWNISQGYFQGIIHWETLE